MEKVLDLNDSQVAYERKEVSGIAMVVTLVSFAMLFATLLLGYFVLRASAEVWPPMGFNKVALLKPIISTIIVFLSSATLFLAQKGFEKRDVAKFKKHLYLTMLLGCGFIVSQLTLWNEMNLTGLTVDTGTFASILHGFTWIHAAHIVLGIIGLLFLIPAAHKAQAFARYDIRIDNVSKFWHFLSVVWLIMFIVLFVL